MVPSNAPSLLHIFIVSAKSILFIVEWTTTQYMVFLHDRKMREGHRHRQPTYSTLAMTAQVQQILHAGNMCHVNVSGFV